MSVSDPLIKDIKEYTRKFLEELNISKKITDQCPILIPFCTTLENIFTYGLEKQDHGIPFNRNLTAFKWMSKVDETNSNFSYSYCLENISKHSNILTDAGRLRLLIRRCLVEKCLHVPLEYLKKSSKADVYYRKSSIIGDEILLELLLSVLYQYPLMNFDLDLDNTSFLDTTWSLPKRLILEMVPTDALGISISFSANKAVIVDIQSGSVVDETGCIEVGDILDSLNGQHITQSSKGRLRFLLKTGQKRPVNLAVIKAINPETKDHYLPMIKVLSPLNIKINLRNGNNVSNKPANEKTTKTKSPRGAGYKVTYIGCIEVGQFGDLKLISKAMKSLISCNRNLPYFLSENIQSERIDKEASFEIQDLGVRVLDSKNGKVILQHSFMQISSCGSGNFSANYFAYVAGEDCDTCNSASKFVCFVFYAANNDDAVFILQSIGQGFQRTHFVV